MTTTDRPIAAILQGILDNLQELVRSEVALAKREIADDAERGRAAVVMLAAGAAAGLLGFHFLLWCAVYALALRLPMWAATGIPAVVLLVIAGVAVSIGLKRWRLVSFTPERTVATLKESVEWVKQSTR